MLYYVNGFHFSRRLASLNMKDTTHRKRNKSESDSRKTPDKKDSHAHDGSQHGHQKTQHGGHQGGHHDAHHASHHKSDRGHQKTDQGHHKGDHGHHKADHGYHRGDHSHHSDHGHHDNEHHHSASSHAYRPRRDTMLSRGGHSTHHESDRRSIGTNDGGGSVHPVVYYENTYKLMPDDKFHEGKVKEVIRTALEENVTEKTYDPNTCGAKCKLISEIVKERVKKLDLNRFKIVCVVTIGQVFEQSMLVTSRCLWNHKFDNAVSVEFRKGDIVAVGVVFAVYVE